MNILELEDVSYTYGADTPFEIRALNHVSVGFEKGSITGIIGHTGSGKSTMVQLLNGLLRPDSGRILLDGADIWEKTKQIRRVRCRVGLVMQYPEYQLFDETVRGDIGYAPRNMGLSPEEIDARVQEAAEFVHLPPELLDRSPFSLSGGQKRRAAIAGVIAMRPRCIVLDEPTAMLDPQGRREVLETVMRLNRESGITVVLITHHMREAALAGRVIAMSDGGILADGTPKEVFRQVELLRSAGLNVPETTQLLYELNKSGLHLPLEALSVEECAEALYHDLKDSGGTPQ